MHGPGRPKGSTRQATQQQHANFYRLWLMGWSESQIAETFKVNQSTVSRAVDLARHRGSWGNKTAKERFTGLIQESYDEARLTLSESWRLYHDPTNKDKPELRQQLLGRVQSAVTLITRLVPDSQALASEQRMVELEAMAATVLKQQETIREKLKEKELASKVLSIQES